MSSAVPHVPRVAPLGLRRREDLRTLGFVASYYVLVSWAWTCGPVTFAGAAPLTVLLAVVSWFCAVIAHNTVHTPVFRGGFANRLFQVALTCAYGFPISEYVPGHNLSHHRFLQGPADVMRTTKAPFVRFNALNLLYFFPRVGFDVTVQNYRYVERMKGARRAWYRQLLVEILACWGVKVALLWVDWRKALLFIIVPHLWALYGITTVNFLQHDGCDESHPYNHSRNFVGSLFNWFTFNNGYHGMHHEQPTMHWADLPAAHRAYFGGHISPALEQASLFVYLMKTFVFSWQRRRYDDVPIRDVTLLPDAEWMPPLRESAA